jgi:hypothetical protein
VRAAQVVAVVAFFSLVFSKPLLGQQSGPPDAQATILVEKAHALMARSTSISDVVITGNARRIAGSDNESGTVTWKAMTTGEASEEFSFPSGQRREVRGSAAGKSGGRWSGPDGTLHAMAEHNSKVEGAWFCPVVLLHRVVSSQDKTVRYLGSETVENQTLERVRVASRDPAIPEKASPQIVQLVQHLTEMDFYLDSVTLLPSKITFNEHPDSDASKDIPVEIYFSDYRVVNAVQVPFHLQKYFNGSLVLEVQVDSVVLNSGLSASTFSLQ